MKKRTYQEAVKITVEWWSKKSFDVLLNQDNGDDSENGGMAWLLMNFVSAKAKEGISKEKRTKFENKLTELLMEKEGKGRMWNQLDVDYNPNEILSIACEFAGINSNCLPCKTFTFIDENNAVKGRYQYGGEWFEL